MSEQLSLEERIEFLEAQNEGLKRSGVLLLALTLLIGVMLVVTSRSQTSSVQTENLVMTNESNPRLALTPMPSGHLGMVFFDDLGLLPTAINHAVIPPLDGIVMYDRAGNPRIIMGIGQQNEPVFAIVDATGKPVFEAISREDALKSAGVTNADPANPGQSGSTPAPATTPTPQATP